MKNVFTFIMAVVFVVISTVSFGAEAHEELKQFAAQHREQLIKDVEEVNRMMQREKNRADYIITIQHGDEHHVLEISESTIDVIDEWIKSKTFQASLKGDVIITKEEIMMVLEMLKAGIVEK